MIIIKTGIKKNKKLENMHLSFQKDFAVFKKINHS